MHFRNFIFLFVCVCSIAVAAAQNTSRLKSRIQYENTDVRYMEIYDTSGYLVFKKMSDDVVMAYAYTYDVRGNRTQMIAAHSNAGFSVYEYALDSAGNRIAAYAYDEPENQKGHIENFNTWLSIVNYHSADELLHDTVVLSMVNSGKKYLLYEYTYDSLGNELTKTDKNEDGTIRGTHHKKYTCRDTVCLLMQDDSRIFSYDANNKKISSATITNGDTIINTLYAYNEQGLLVKMTEFYEKGLYISLFEYENGLLKTEKHLKNNKKLTFLHTLEYDERNNLIKETKENFTLKKKQIYRWDYEFY